jgi:hypothetical protein
MLLPLLLRKRLNLSQSPPIYLGRGKFFKIIILYLLHHEPVVAYVEDEVVDPLKKVHPETGVVVEFFIFFIIVFHF